MSQRIKVGVRTTTTWGPYEAYSMSDIKVPGFSIQLTQGERSAGWPLPARCRVTVEVPVETREVVWVVVADVAGKTLKLVADDSEPRGWNSVDFGTGGYFGSLKPESLHRVFGLLCGATEPDPDVDEIVEVEG